MFHSSTQRKDWLFKDVSTLNEHRGIPHQTYCEAHAQLAKERGAQFLSKEEEYVIVQYYLKKLIEFCNLFNPPSWAHLPRTALVS